MTRTLLSTLARLVALLCASLAVPAGALRAQPAGLLAPLDAIVGDDGSLSIGDDAAGSYDPSGWVMTTGPDGVPRFFRKEDPRLLAVPGDEHWDSRFGPPGVGGPVHAVAAWGDEVFLGGSFRVAGTAIANNVVAYNTATNSWQLLGGELTNGVGGPVYALATFAGNLYVGGTFESAGGLSASGIARWDIQRRRWSSLGGGVASVENTWVYPGHVYAIAADSHSVFVGGMFLMADADTVGNLARWDIASQSWSAACKSDVNRTNGVINALALDGGSLYVGGTFTQVADIVASRVARWDLVENAWHPMGAGLNGPVLALNSYGGRIVAAGSFAASGAAPARNIAEWTGSAWRQLGGGLDSTVYALHAAGASLYAGGLFTAPGSGAAALNGIAEWRGGGWAQVGLGVADDTLPLVRALVTANGRLYAGGNFTTAGVAAAYSIAQWDTVWSALGTRRGAVLHGTDAPVYALAIDGDNVYIGGDFATAGGIAARRVARWSRSSGLWYPLGSGIDGVGSLVRAMAIDGLGNLYVGGILPGAGGVASRGVVRWDGTRWTSMAGGVSGISPYVFALAHDNGTIYVGGAFDSAGAIASPRIARWSTSSGSWSDVAGGIRGDTTYTYVAALAASNGRLIVGGEFRRADTLLAERLLDWRGAGWLPIGIAPRYGVNAPVSALAIDGEDVIIGGDFTRAGAESVRYFARWRGGAWHRDSALDGPVRSLRWGTGRTLLVGGEFTHIGTRAIQRIAALDAGAGTWLGFAAGTNGPVTAIAAIDDEVYTGGSFSSAGGARSANIAQWREGAWSAMGSDPSIGINDTILAMVVKGSDIYVGGRFRTAGGIRTNGIARWDGDRWRTVGTGFGGADPVVRALALAPGGDIYAGGAFTTAGRDSVYGIARWDGTRWNPLGSGVRGSAQRPASIYAIAIGDDAIYVAGELRRAGEVAATNVARWTPSTSSWSALGGGLRGSTPFPLVRALAVHDGSLVAAGRFDSAGSIAARYVARWDGASWRSMGTATYEGRALAVRGTELVLAAGSLERITIPPATEILRSAYNLSRWNGSEWTPFAGGTGVINALALDARGGLYIGGYIAFIGETEVNGIARWDGASWSNLGSGLVGINHRRDFTIGAPFALASVGDDLYAGGNFIIAGRKPSYYFARWNSTISESPLDPTPTITMSAVGVTLAPSPVDRGGTLRVVADEAIVAVRLYDMLGAERLVLTQSAEARALDLAIGDLSAGAYLVRVETTKGVGVGRVVVR
jgi:trimeric autotransporter adhesin